MIDIYEIGKRAKKASVILRNLQQDVKKNAMFACAEELMLNSEEIINANKIDLEKAKSNGMSEGMLDRLMLNKERIAAMADGIKKVAVMADPIGKVLSMEQRPNGLMIGKRTVPIGVIGIIYESRPNVTADAFALCFKSGNAVILRGGKEALNSNIAIANTIRTSLSQNKIDEDVIIMIESTERELAEKMMCMNEYMDLLIPRGGAELIKNVIKKATVPVIQTGTGNCHIYVDEYADRDMALNIIINAKTQRLGVCNACESLVVHSKIAESFLPKLSEALKSKNVEIRADERACKICKEFVPATEEDFYKEYLDRIISLKIVDSIDEAIDHINVHNTGHSESIITKDYDNSMKFLDMIDAAAVYVNASTRFTDGNEFGMGAEIGISTQKLHARGPLGLNELTTSKYIILGNGQIRK